MISMRTLAKIQAKMVEVRKALVLTNPADCAWVTEAWSHYEVQIVILNNQERRGEVYFDKQSGEFLRAIRNGEAVLLHHIVLDHINAA